MSSIRIDNAKSGKNNKKHCMGRCAQTFNRSCFRFLVNNKSKHHGKWNHSILKCAAVWRRSGRKPIGAQNVSSPPALKARRVVSVTLRLKRAAASYLQTSCERTCLPVRIFSISAASLEFPFNVASLQWCPPCRALLPELRKASIQLAGQMKFGTIDCTIHHNLCSMVRAPVGILTFSLDRNVGKSRKELVSQCNDLLLILDLQIGQKCDINQGQMLICLSFYYYFFLLAQHPGLSDHGHL